MVASRSHFPSYSRVTQSMKHISSPISGQHTFKYLYVSLVTCHSLNTCSRVSTGAAHFGHTTSFISLLYCRLHKVVM
ncbi:hypothetical protein V6Z11_A11G244100 [Gossypium hirsutum]